MKPNAGFTLIELMVSMVIMAIISVGVAQFAAVSFGQQARHTGETLHLTEASSSTSILERDLMYAGFGLPAGVAAFQVRAGVTTATSNELVIAGLPLAGPRRTPWTYVQESASASSVLQVRCYGMLSAGTVYPQPLTDVVVGATPLPAQLFNYVGQSPPGLPLGGVNIIANDATCTQSGADYDGDGQPDLSMRLSLDRNVSAMAGTLVIPQRSFPGMATTAIRYFVSGQRLWREAAGAPAAPVIDNVEAFQVQFGWSVTDGTFAPGNWSNSPQWKSDLRQRAVRYQLVLARAEIGGFTRADYPGINFTYAVPAGTANFVREDIRRTVYTPNALFSHP